MIEALPKNTPIGSTGNLHFVNNMHYRASATLVIFVLVYALFFTGSSVIAADSNTDVTKSSLVVPYSGPAPRGPLKFPLYKGKNFQYFSAGVGLEERQLTYPPFQLKLILVQGARAFLSNVSITVRQLDGPLTFDIPATQVEGPWVFLNLPTGTYLITAANSQDKKIEKQVSVKKEQPQTIHLRWTD